MIRPSLVGLLVCGISYLIEIGLYCCFSARYYGSGPALVREQWQTNASAEQVRQVIRGLLNQDGLVGRERRGLFCLRLKAQSFNTWPRVALRIEDSPHGSTLSYEVRPYYSMAVVTLALVWMLADGVGLGVYVVLGLMVLTGAGYSWLLPYDIRRINRLPTIRRALAPLGLQLCNQCGYDMFMKDAKRPCPECGKNPSGGPQDAARDSGAAE